MSDQKNTPQNPDEALAKAWGKALEEGTDGASIKDPLFKQLQDYKVAELQDTSVSDNQKSRVWSKIQQKIGFETPKANIHRLGQQPQRQAPRFLWLAAAILLIAAAGLWFFLPTSGSMPIYKSLAQQTTIELPDGSRVTLRPYSRLEGISEHNYTLRGEGYFEIISNPDRVFSIQTQQGEVQVLGTTFTLSSRENGSSLYLYEGLVRVQNERDTLLINPTQAAEWTSTQGQIARINDADEGLYADWREGLLRFVQQNASDIIPELEQHFNINIALPEKQQSMQLSGSVRLQEVDESLNYLGLLLGGRFEQVEENAYRFIEE